MMMMGILFVSDIYFTVWVLSHARTFTATVLVYAVRLLDSCTSGQPCAAYITLFDFPPFQLLLLPE